MTVFLSFSFLSFFLFYAHSPVCLSLSLSWPCCCCCYPAVSLIFLVPATMEEWRTNRKEKVHHILVARKRREKKAMAAIHVGQGSFCVQLGPPVTPSKVVLAVDQENCPENATASQQSLPAPSSTLGPILFAAILFSQKPATFQMERPHIRESSAISSAATEQLVQTNPNATKAHSSGTSVSSTTILYIKYFHHRL